MNNSNFNAGRNRSQSVTTNTRVPTLQRAMTRNRRAFSDPTPISNAKVNKKRVPTEEEKTRKRVAKKKDIKILEDRLIDKNKDLKKVESEISCHEKNGYFCAEPKSLYPKGTQYANTLDGLKLYRQWLIDTIELTKGSIIQAERIIALYSPKFFMPPQGSSLYPIVQNHKRNNFLNPNNMQYNSSSGGKRRTRRMRRMRTRRH